MPLIGVVELVLHLKETTSDVVPDTDWMAARDAVKADVKPDDLVIFAPFWADPVGRQFFGDELAGIKREARPDESRFRRAFEVGIRGAHRAELASWKKVSEKQVGKVTIGTYENPAPVTLHDDLLDLATSDRLTASKVDATGEQPCAWQHGAGQAGSLIVPQGPAVPGDKLTCPGGGYVGVAVIHALDHHPHLCLFVSPQGPGTAMRVKFAGVSFGNTLYGHSGVQWVNERTPTQDRMQIAFSVDSRTIGTNVHKVGVGWTFFQFPTTELAGKRGDLVAEVTNAGPRQFCFEADTRDVAP